MASPLTPAKRLQVRPRPSVGTTHRDQPPTSPLLSPSASTPSLSMLARKTSYNQLTQNSLAAIPDASAGYAIGSMRAATPAKNSEIDVGDPVNTPGGMYGTVKFIGSVKGKAGIFIGVELDPELAGRGKNDGTVDGVRYFTTARPMSGIFVPLGRATKRNSTSSSNAPPTPTIPTLTPPSLTPGRGRSESPAGRIGSAKTPTRLSGSPVRKATPGPSLLPPTTPRTASAAGRYGALSPTPGGKLSLGRIRAGSMSSNTGLPDPRTPAGFRGAPRLAQTPKQTGLGLKQPKFGHGLRTGSAMGLRSASALDRRTEEEPPDTSPIDSGIGIAKSEDMIEEGTGEVDGSDTVALKAELAQKELQLKEQAASLLEMEASFTELQALMGNTSPSGLTSPRSSSFEDADVAQLRAALREKNEKIQHLTAEFDAHRADFRSTIDTLELAGAETQRVYEKRIEDLMAELRELQQGNQDVESVARQLQEFGEQVAELEEGLEDARRGEAEARGEVEFLRGEVERGREELRREREKNAAAVANAAVGKMMRNGSIGDELEKKDAEIRGLKEIIHSLSRDSVSLEDGTTSRAGNENGTDDDGGEDEELAKERMTREKLEKEVHELSELIRNKVSREDELEREIEELKKRREARNSATSVQSSTGTISEKTVTPGVWGGRTSGERRDSRSTVGSWRARHQAMPSSSSLNSQKRVTLDTSETVRETAESPAAGELTPIDSDADSSVPWCEICETAGHDILTCTNMFGSGAGGPASAGPKGDITAAEAAAEEERAESVSRQSHHSEPSNAEEVTVPSPTPDAGEVGLAASSPSEMTVAEKKKSVHLPPPPPMIDGNFGPVAGKESGEVDMQKWCALCERDGHDSVDCPFETDF